MKKLLSLVVIVFCIFQNNRAQVQSFEICTTNAVNLSADIHGMLYLTYRNKLHKLNPKTGERINYSGRQSLNFSAAEVSDPFKIMVYDKSFREFLFFDKQLKLLSNTKLQLPDEFFEKPLFVRNNQAFYIFNPETFELYKYGLYFQFIEKYFLQELQSSQISELLAVGGKLHFLSKKNQIFSFSSEGAFIGSHNVSDYNEEQVSYPVFIQIDNEVKRIKLIDPINKTYKTVTIGQQTDKTKAAALHRNSLFFIIKNSLRQTDLK